MLQLLPDRCCETLGVGNTDPKQGVFPEADDPWNFVDERDAQSLAMIRAEGNAIISQAEPQANGGVPAVRAGDERVINVVKCGLHLETSKGRDEFALAGDAHAVFFFHAECEKQRAPSLVEPIWEMLCSHELFLPF